MYFSVKGTCPSRRLRSLIHSDVVPHHLSIGVQWMLRSFCESVRGVGRQHKNAQRHSVACEATFLKQNYSVGSWCWLHLGLMTNGCYGERR